MVEEMEDPKGIKAVESDSKNISIKQCRDLFNRPGKDVNRTKWVERLSLMDPYGRVCTEERNKF